MSVYPVSDDIAGALAGFFANGSGPTQANLTRVFAQTGYGHVDEYRPKRGNDLGGPNKEVRVMNVIRAAVQQPARSRELIDGLLELLSGSFRGSTGEAKRRVEVAQRAFAREGWSLSADGKLYSLGEPELVTGGRQALDEQLSRLRNSAGDPGQALGSAKEVLEAVAKFVLEEFGVKTPKSFGELLSAARTQLGIHPRQIVGDAPGNAQVRSILQASWTIAKEVDDLRNLQGTGHGRTLPTGITPEIAMLVVREACSNAQFLLSSLDAHMAEKAVSDTD